MKLGIEIERSFKDKLKTQNNFYQQSQFGKDTSRQAISRWSGQEFYLKIKEKIHQKINTEPFEMEKFGKYNKNLSKFIKDQKNGSKPKSKLVINTLQLALEPSYNKNINNFQLKTQKCIHSKIQQQKSNLKKIYVRPNKSAKVLRTQNFSPQKQKIYPSCRLNYQPLDQSNCSSILMPSKQRISEQRLKQKIAQTKHLRFNKTKSESHLKGSLKLKQIPKPQQDKTIKNNVFLFYFQSKNNIRISSRQKNINKIRRKSKTMFSVK